MESVREISLVTTDNNIIKLDVDNLLKLFTDGIDIKRIKINEPLKVLNLFFLTALISLPSNDENGGIENDKIKQLLIDSFDYAIKYTNMDKTFYDVVDEDTFLSISNRFILALLSVDVIDKK